MHQSLYPIKGAEAYNLGAGSADDVGIKVIDEKTIRNYIRSTNSIFLRVNCFQNILSQFTKLLLKQIHIGMQKLESIMYLTELTH